ncbi:MAG TPA: AAA family ATPase [Azospirillum sp.]|nr:AAA family ATPase [Azospirillum sp.]
MQIRRITIQRYRGLHQFAWSPSPGVNCLIGPGDAGKSTVLAAIALLLAPYPVGACSEFDYHKRQVADGFEIEAVITLPPTGALAGERLPLFVRGWLNDALTDLPDEGGAEPVLVCRVRGTPDMEALHEIIPASGEPVPFSIPLRKKLMLARLSGEERAARDLRIASGSVLDRFLGKIDLRPSLHQAVAAASQQLALPDGVADAMAKLSGMFDGAGLPAALHLGLIPAPGMPLSGMVALLHGDDPATAIPFAMSGTGTRQLALLEMSSSLAGADPILVVDEPERGLEPYRQRAAAKRLVELVGDNGQVFVTTHSPYVLRCMPQDAIWHLRDGGAAVRFEGDPITRLLRDDPATFFAPVPVFCEGPTEQGLLEELLPGPLGCPLDAAGIHLIDGEGQPNVLNLIRAFAVAGVSCAGFLDNEDFDPEIRRRLAASCTLFIWNGAVNIEHAIARYLPLEQLPLILDWAEEAKDIPRRQLEDQLLGHIGGARTRDFGGLVEANGEEAVRRGLYAAMTPRRNAWFKTRLGGAVLARGLLAAGTPPQIGAQLMDFIRRLKAMLP